MHSARALFVGAALLSLLSCSAVAEWIPDGFEIRARVDGFTVVELVAGPDDFEWTGAAWHVEFEPDLVMRDFGGNYCATLAEAEADIGPGSIEFQFGVQAGPRIVEFEVSCSAHPADAIAPATACASAAMTLTDGPDEDGAGAWPLDASGMVTAAYNDDVAFSSLINLMVADPMGTSACSEQFPGGGLYSPLISPVERVQLVTAFSLTANDLFSGTQSFEVIPEPATAALVLLAGLSARRRARA